ncbi:MAG: TIGR02996 domain-containing protein [Blastocatellia bacterium]|nr:TIGR02996 domain-containing protein [Blastocatellia bacterium]
MAFSESRFLTEIANHPEDRERRLQYAGWLEANREPRAELIRLEEEMRGLPIYGDRYWELKPRRNALRSQCQPDWLAQLKYGTEYEPVFREVPQGWKERWRLLREFVERWHGIPLGDVGRYQEKVQETESQLHRSLPPAVKEWIAFSHELLEAGWFGGVLRDDYWVEDLVEHNNVSLLIQCEGDFYWAVKNEYLSEDDPHVTGYLLDDEGGLDDSFTENGIEAASITDFVFCHVNGCSHGHGGGFRVEVPASEVQEKLDVTFGRSSGFGDFRVYEAPNLFITLHPSEEEETEASLHVEVWKPEAVDTIPKFLWDYLKGGGMFHGVFADHL